VSPGVGVLPLACSAACPGFLALDGFGVAVGTVADSDPSGLVRPLPQATADRAEEADPLELAVPAFGQVARLGAGTGAWRC
jgi:hypothetical protein